MKKLTHTLTMVWMSAILLSTLSVHGMEKSNASLPQRIYNQLSYLVSILWTPNQYAQQELTAEEYNDTNCLLTSLPPETLTDIFSYCLLEDNLSVKALAKSEDQAKSLKNSIKNFMRLSTTCKKFNTVLTFEAIGSLCKSYALADKNKVLQSLMKRMFASGYAPRRLPVSILIYADADANTELCSLPLLHRIVSHHTNDTQLAAMLFKHHANPNVRIYGTPVFFHAKTLEMAQLFIDSKDFNVHASRNDAKTNVLWHIVDDTHPSELMALYLTHKVDVEELHPWDNAYILHELARPNFLCKINNIDDFLKKAKLLLDAMPGMINAVNKYWQTPIDVAQGSLELSKVRGGTPEAFKQLITLFREYGAKD